MPRIIIFFLKSIILVLLLINNLYAEELTIIPLKKPVLDKIIEQQKLTQGIIKPKSKPIKKIKEQILSKETIKPTPKPTKQTKKIQKKLVKKNKKETAFLIPKSKPLVVRKKIIKTQKTSKYYRKKDFNFAKKSINAFEKGQWTKAISLSKNARDKSIYNFIQWKHLLTSGIKLVFMIIKRLYKKIKITQE